MTNGVLVFCSHPHSNEYLCFQKIMKAEYMIPDGFPDQATDLVKALLVRSSLHHHTIIAHYRLKELLI